MSQKIIFNAQFHNTGRRIKSISGRVGYFIFRTYRDGHISAYYMPNKRWHFDETSSSQYRTIIESLSNHLREIAADLGLSVESITFDFREQ